MVDALGERISQTVAASRDVIERSECERGGQAAPPVTSIGSLFFLSCGTSLRSPPHAPPSGHGWFDGAASARSIEPSNSGHRV